MPVHVQDRGRVVKDNTKQREGGVSEERERKIRGERGGKGGKRNEESSDLLKEKRGR